MCRAAGASSPASCAGIPPRIRRLQRVARRILRAYARGLSAHTEGVDRARTFRVGGRVLSVPGGVDLAEGRCNQPHPRLVMSGTSRESATLAAELGATMGLLRLTDFESARAK